MKPTESSAARQLLTWAADAELDSGTTQVANYALATTSSDKREQEDRHALSAYGPDPEIASLSGLRGGVLAVERGDLDRAETLLSRATAIAVVETADGVLTHDASFWAATHLGALLIGEGRLPEAERAYGIAAAASHTGILDAVSQGMRRIVQLRSPQRQAAEPPGVA